MKKILLLIFTAMAFLQMNAQKNLDEYAGRYIFPAGSLTDDAIITVTDNAVLNISSSVGGSDLNYVEDDKYTLPQYGGTIIFVRDDSKNIQGFRISIPMAEVENLEAKKENSQSTDRQFETHAHRGNRGGQPENTIVSMIDAMDIGVTTLEMDLQITKDKKVIVSHDAYFNQNITTTPDGKFLTGDEARNRILYTMTYDSISKYDVGLKPNPNFPLKKNIAAKKPLLSDLLSATEAHAKEKNISIHYNIEIKSRPNDDGIQHPPVEEFVDLAMEVISKAGIESRTIIQSFDSRALQVMHRKYPNMKLSYLIEKNDKQTVDDIIEQLGFVPEVLSPLYTLVTPAMVNSCHSKNIKVIPWTVNDMAEMKNLKDMGVDGLISDYPDRLIQIK